MTEQEGCFILSDGFPADRGLWQSRPCEHYWVRKAQESTECPICAQLQQERERAESEKKFAEERKACVARKLKTAIAELEAESG